MTVVAGAATDRIPTGAHRPDQRATRGHHRRRGGRSLAVLAAGAGVLAAIALVAASVGSSGVTFSQAARAMWARAAGTALSPDELRIQTLVWELRFPRIAMAIAAGAGLSMAGVVMQGLLRNPLVSPFTLGISSAAACGASLALIFEGTFLGTGQVSVVASAFVFALGCAGLVLALSSRRRASPETLILVGMALTYLFAAITATLQYLASDEQLAEVVRWTFGSVNGAQWGEAVVVGAVVLACLPLLLYRASALNAVAFAGDDAARSLGVNVSRLRLTCSLLAVVLAATVVSFTGVIGFVGLVGPHIARLVIGPDYRFLVPFSAVSGAALLLVADTAGRTVFSPSVIPVGIVVSFIGAPLFLNLVLARRRSFL